MFLGEYQHTLDAKCRLSLPARFRQGMTGKLIIAKGFEDCLYVFPAEAYADFLDSLLQGDDFEPRFRKLRRFFTTGAIEAELDSAGRIGVPQVLRDYGGLEKDVTIVGNGDRIEVWDSGRWVAYTDAMSTIEEDAKELAQQGLL